MYTVVTVSSGSTSIASTNLPLKNGKLSLLNMHGLAFLVINYSLNNSV